MSSDKSKEPDPERAEGKRSGSPFMPAVRTRAWLTKGGHVVIRAWYANQTEPGPPEEGATPLDGKANSQKETEKDGGTAQG